MFANDHCSFLRPKVETMFLGLLVLNMLGAATAGKCELQLIENQTSCFMEDALWDLPRKTLYALSPMIISDGAEGCIRCLFRPQIPPRPTSSLIPRSFGSPSVKSFCSVKAMWKSSQTHAVEISQWKPGNTTICGTEILCTWRCNFTVIKLQKMAKSMKWCKPNSDGRTRTRRCITIAPQRSSSTQGSALAWMPLVRAQASWRSSCSRSLDRYATCPCGAATHKFVHNLGTKSSPTSANTGANTSANTGANTGTNTSANTGTNTGANTSANTGANTCANTHIGSLRRNGCWDCDLDLAHLGPHRWCCCFLLQASEASARRRSSAQCKGSGVELRDAAVPRYPTIIDRCHPCHALKLPCRNQEICVRARL